MTTFTFTYAGGALPMPRIDNGLSMESFPIGTSRRMANGSYRAQYIASKWRVVVSWEGLTSAERTTLWNSYIGHVATSGVVLFPSGLTFTAYTDLASWTETQWYSATSTVLYNISYAFVEV